MEKIKDRSKILKHIKHEHRGINIDKDIQTNNQTDGRMDRQTDGLTKIYAHMDEFLSMYIKVLWMNGYLEL